MRIKDHEVPAHSSDKYSKDLIRSGQTLPPHPTYISRKL
jgi:hypothetical protein